MWNLYIYVEDSLFYCVVLKLNDYKSCLMVYPMELSVIMPNSAGAENIVER